MGKLALAAKTTHVPSMYLCEFPEPNFGKRDTACAAGVKSWAYSATSLELEYGTLVPMRYMNADKHYKVICISACGTVGARRAPHGD